MEGYMTLLEYLNNLGLLGTNDLVALEKAKREYRKGYMREYKRKRRKELHEVVISFSQAEYAQLSLWAERYDMTVPKFLLHLYISHVEKKPVIYQAENYNGLQLMLGQWYSQLIYMANHLKSETIHDDVIDMKGKIELMEKEIAKASHVQGLEAYLSDMISHDESGIVRGILQGLLERKMRG